MVNKTNYNKEYLETTEEERLKKVHKKIKQVLKCKRYFIFIQGTDDMISIENPFARFTGISYSNEISSFELKLFVKEILDILKEGGMN